MQRTACLVLVLWLMLACKERKPAPALEAPSTVAVPTYQLPATPDAAPLATPTSSVGPQAEKGTEVPSLQELMMHPAGPLQKLSDVKPDMLRRDVTKLLGASNKPSYDERLHCTPLQDNDDLRNVTRWPYISLGSEDRRLVPMFENDRLVAVDVIAIDDNEQPLTIQSDTLGWWTGKLQLAVVGFSCTSYRRKAELPTYVTFARLTPIRSTPSTALSCKDLLSLGPSLLGKTLEHAVSSPLGLTIEDHESSSDIEQLPYQQGAKVLADQKCKLEAMTYGKSTIRTLLIEDRAGEQDLTDFYQHMIKRWGQPQVRPDNRGVLMLQFSKPGFSIDAYRTDRWTLIVKL
jgi:hypothetical protein